jgi:hypothetical protein
VALVQERTIPTERPPFIGEFSANFCEYRGCRVVITAESYGRNLRFLDQSCYFFFQIALNCTHEAEWTPFQTHYFSGNLVVPGIEPEPLDL